MDLSGVTSVVVEGDFVVRLRTGDPARATITMDDNLTDLVETTVTGNQLRLGIKPGVRLRDASLSADITVGKLDRLVVTGASQVTLNPTLVSPALELVVSGSSLITGPIAIGQLKATISGATTLALSGRVDHLRLSAVGANGLSLADLTVHHLEVKLTGLNHATVTVTDTLSAEASGLSVLHYRGDPNVTKSHTLGPSSISKDSA